MDWRPLNRRRNLSIQDQTAGGDQAAKHGSPDSAQAFSRRRAFGRMAGMAAVGAAGGAVLIEVVAPPASAATTTESGAVAPAVVELTDAAQIAINASLGNDFRVTLQGNRTLANPTNPTDGQKIVVQVTQGSGGPYTLSFGTAYGFAAALPSPELSTAAGSTDLLAFIYNAGMEEWLLVAYVTGFSATAATPTPTPTATVSRRRRRPRPWPAVTTGFTRPRTGRPRRSLTQDPSSPELCLR